MATARSEVVTEGVGAVYHCISRCVRWAFLCGTDTYSGKSHPSRIITTCCTQPSASGKENLTMGKIHAAVVVTVLLLSVLAFPVNQPVCYAGENMIQATVGDLEPGVVIHVCWRLIKQGNPFLAEGPFDCGNTVEALDAPFPGGGLNGDQLMSVVEKAVGTKKIVEVRARGLTAGQDAADPGANMITVDAGANEFFNNYIGRDSQGRFAVFLDIEVQGE